MKGRISSRKRFEEVQYYRGGAVERVDGNPFITRMSLRDIPGAKNDAGNAAVSQNRGVAKIIDAGGLALAHTGQELPDQWERGIGFQGQTGGKFTVVNGRFQISPL